MAHDELVRAWAARLSSGDPITWSAFVAAEDAAPGGGTPPDAGMLPGSAQLELLRRIALVHAEQPVPDLAGLAGLVLASAGPGRGLVDPPLPGAPRTFGVPAVEPENLPATELLRAAAGVLVPLLRDTRPAPASRRGRRWGRSRRFVALGSPLTARAVADRLVADGWREGSGRGARYVVVGRDLETMMAEHWESTTRGGSERRWRPLWRRVSTLDRLPPRLDLTEIAERLVADHGPDAVHVVLARDDTELRAGLEAALAVPVDVGLAVPDPQAADLLRRLNPFLVIAGASRGPWRDLLVETRATLGPPVPVGAPPGMRRWARRTARTMAARVRAAAEHGDYAVHGDPAALVPDPDRQVDRAVEPGPVAELATALIVTLWRRRTEGGR